MKPTDDGAEQTIAEGTRYRASQLPFDDLVRL
jgi:hypothetical protein